MLNIPLKTLLLHNKPGQISFIKIKTEVHMESYKRGSTLSKKIMQMTREEIELFFLGLKSCFETSYTSTYHVFQKKRKPSNSSLWMVQNTEIKGKNLKSPDWKKAWNRVLFQKITQKFWTCYSYFVFFAFLKKLLSCHF